MKFLFKTYKKLGKDESLINYRWHLDVAGEALGLNLGKGALLLNASLCARCTVRADKTETLERGAEKVLFQCRSRRRVAHALKPQNSLKPFS